MPALPHRNLSDSIRVSQVGYLPDQSKIGVITDASAREVTLRSATDSFAFKLTLGPAHLDEQSGDLIRSVDFSSVHRPGTYFLDAPGVGTSFNFDIGEHVFDRAFRLAARMFTGQRCGTSVSLAPDFPQYRHSECHTDPVIFHASSGTQGQKDATGGWHDAGDYGRYVTNSAVSSGILMWAFELNASKLSRLNLDIPESGGPMPDLLAEVQWNLRWLLAMQDADGGVWHKCTSRYHAKLVQPEDDRLQMMIIGSGVYPYKTTAATADLAAVAAQAARLYKPYEPQFAALCLQASERAWSWLGQHPDVRFTANPPGVSTGAYVDDSPADEVLWASAELARTTHSAEYATYFSQHFSEWAPTVTPDHVIGWRDVHELAMFAYALTPAYSQTAAAKKIREDAVAAAQVMVGRIESNGYRIALQDKDYYIGSNGAVVSFGMNLIFADRLAHNPAYRKAALEALSYVFGCNTFNTSFVTWLGSRWPLHPHHRPSISSGLDQPWPGMLVGGPNAQGKTPPARQWHDDDKIYSENEVAINWNAPLVFVLADAIAN